MKNNMCDTCPFQFNDASEQVQNYGCLPTAWDIRNMHKDGKNWACHETTFKDGNAKICIGLALDCKENNMPLNTKNKLIDITDW